MPLRHLSWTALLALGILTIAAAASAQPPANPLYRSIAGPTAEPSIYDAVSLTSHQLLTLSLQFSKEQEKQKVVFAPFKLREGYVPFWSEMLLNFAQEGTASTIGVGLGWTNASPAGRRAQSILKSMTFTAQEPGPENETEAQRLRRDKDFYDLVLVPAYNKFYSRLAAKSYQVTFGFNVQTFSMLAGSPIDVDEDGKIDNQFALRGFDASANALYTWDQAKGMTAAYHFSRKRASAVEGQELVNYHGMSLSGGYRVAVLDREYEKSEAYLKSLFIPSIVIGGALEYQECTDAGARCEKGLKRQSAFTPYVDFKVSTQAQFRLSFPIRLVTQTGKKSEVELAPAVQFAVQMAGGK